ncbi:9019_t:CDS:2, partial [Racocetra persica]
EGPYHTIIENRGNVILLGDSIGDIHMSDGIQHETCLTIGFLNHMVEDLINIYLETFDIVVVDDGPMDIVNNILDACSKDSYRTEIVQLVDSVDFQDLWEWLINEMTEICMLVAFIVVTDF